MSASAIELQRAETTGSSGDEPPLSEAQDVLPRCQAEAENASCREENLEEANGQFSTDLKHNEGRPI